MKKFKELTEQHREKGRFKPVKPHNVSSVAAASPRSSSDSASAKLKEEKKDKYDEGEYDQEGDMAKSDLRSIMANAKELHDMIDDADNLPEWCQNKITLAEDYISTVANYMTAEMNEEVKTVTVKHKTSGKELVVSPEKAKQLKPQGYHPVKEEVEQIDEEKHKGIFVHAEVEDGSHDDVDSVKDMHTRIAAAAKEHGGKIHSKERPTLSGGGFSIHASGPSEFHKAVHHIVKTSHPLISAEHELDEEVEQIDEKNEPTNPALWSRAKALARSKFDVYPSAYANGWASKWYKSKGGSWRSVSEATEPPFDKPYTTVKKVVTDKSGAKHSPMSRARDIARMAMKKQMEKMKPVKESLEESRKAEIVKEIMKKKKANSEDAFQKDPELTATLTKGI